MMAYVKFVKSFAFGIPKWFRVSHYTLMAPEHEKIMKYKIVLWQSEEGFSVSCPGLPGCWSQGKTEQEAIENIKDAIREYLEAITEVFQNADVREIEVAA